MWVCNKELPQRSRAYERFQKTLSMPMGYENKGGMIIVSQKNLENVRGKLNDAQILKSK